MFSSLLEYFNSTFKSDSLALCNYETSLKSDFCKYLKYKNYFDISNNIYVENLSYQDP